MKKKCSKCGIEKEISVEDMQKIVDANEKLIKELRYETNTISK